jgi:site-specific DNA-methyltransferase (adenine-specific)
MKKTQTSDFGVSKREGHDASAFYARSLYGQDGSGIPRLLIDQASSPGVQQELRTVPPRPLAEWADRIYCHTSEEMLQVPDNSVALAFTSPPYNTGKKYEPDLDLDAYLGLIRRVAAEVYRVLLPGGRYVINVANLGRKPYIPMHAYFYAVHTGVGFLPAGEIIWRKGRGSSGNCAWGSWKSAKAPGLRDLHEYLLVLTKEVFGRPDKGESDISGEEFMEATLSVWEIPPERAKRVGHPAPFPVELASRAMKLYSYVGDVVLDPFCGSGTTCVAAKAGGRHWVGYDTVAEYCNLAEDRVAAADFFGSAK